MHKNLHVWRTVRIPLMIWLGVTFIALSIAPNGWHALMRTCGSYYDAGNYTHLAIVGYNDADGMTAFYPLWPMMLKGLSLRSQDPLVVGRVGALTATVLFLLTIYCVVLWIRQHGLQKYEKLGLALLILSPLSVFRVLGFTESLYSLLAMLLIIELSSLRPQLFWTALWTALLAMTRPLFPILMIAALLSMILLFMMRSRTNVDHFQQLLRKLGVVFCFAPIGYLPFGIFSWQRFGSFWQPFSSQKYWDRSFGFHWSIITDPKVINGSNEVLVWDLLAFYGPFLMLGWLLWQSRSQALKAVRGMTLTSQVTVGVFFALLIECAHSALAFLTHDRFMSLSRHVLANPLLYVSLIALTSKCSENKDRFIKRSFVFLIVASCVFLGMWWFRFTRDQWIG